MYLQIFGDGVQPLLLLTWNCARSPEAQLSSQRVREGFHFAETHRQPVVRRRAGHRRRRLDDVQPVHPSVRIIRVSPPRKLARVAHAAGPLARKSASRERITLAFSK